MHIWWYSAGTKLFMSETASTTRDKEGVGVVSQHRMHGIAVRVIAAAARGGGVIAAEGG